MILRSGTVFAGFFAVAVLVTACNTGNSNHTNVTHTTISPEEKKRSFETLVTSFNKIELPFALPVAETSAAELNKDNINTFFANAAFQPAFEEKDVPDLAENMQSATYVPVGVFQTDAYTALVVLKKDESNYYYLSTFDADGKFIDGLCVAFTEGADGDKTERVAAFNDDYSIQIRQTDIAGGKPNGAGSSAFFEISPDGNIKPLKEGGSKQPV